MKWKTKNQGRFENTRWRRRFAFFPTDLHGGVTVWLEFYWAYQVHWRISGWQTQQKYEKRQTWPNQTTETEHAAAGLGMGMGPPV